MRVETLSRGATGFDLNKSISRANEVESGSRTVINSGFV